jgi:hypothetical protein
MSATNTLKLAFLFDLTAELAPTITLGIGARGERRMVPILTGSFEGPKLRGKLLPGGIDWQITRADGTTEIEAHYSLETDDGVVIRVINKGFRHGPPEVMKQLSNGEPVAPSEYYFRAAPTFETPQGRYGWMNRSLFISSGERFNRSVTLHFYEVL